MEHMNQDQIESQINAAGIKGKVEISFNRDIRGGIQTSFHHKGQLLWRKWNYEPNFKTSYSTTSTL